MGERPRRRRRRRPPANRCRYRLTFEGLSLYRAAFEEAAAARASAKAQKDLWAESRPLSYQIVGSLAIRYPEYQPFLDCPCADAANFLEAQKCPEGASIVHCTDVAPDELVAVEGFDGPALQPRDKSYNRGRQHLAKVWGSGRGDLSDSLTFVNGHRDRRMVEKAMHGQGRLFAYYITPDHEAYSSFRQLFIGSGVILNYSPMGYFAHSKRPLRVGPEIPGAFVFELTWPNGPDGLPMMKGAYE